MSPAAHAIPPLSPRPRLRPPPTRAAHPPTGNWPAPPGPRGPRRRPVGRTSRLPTAPPAAAARGSSAAHREIAGPRARDASTLPPWGLPLGPGVTSSFPTSPAPTASGPPPQSTLQPGALGPMTSCLTIYSPTSLGWGNGEQALKCPKNFPGGALNYVSGACTIFFPYKVGHLFGPETQFKRTWSKFDHFHVTTHSIRQRRPHRRHFAVADGSSGRRLAVVRCPEKQEDAGAGLERVENWPTANWRVRHHQLASFGVENFHKFPCYRRKMHHRFSNRTKQEDLRVLTTSPPSRCPRQVPGLERVANAHSAPKARPANWWAPYTPKPAPAGFPRQSLITVDWRAAPAARTGPVRPGRPLPPSKRPALPGPLMGRY